MWEKPLQLECLGFEEADHQLVEKVVTMKVRIPCRLLVRSPVLFR